MTVWVDPLHVALALVVFSIATFASLRAWAETALPSTCPFCEHCQTIQTNEKARGRRQWEETTGQPRDGGEGNMRDDWRV